MPSSVSRSPVTLPSSTVSLRSWVSCGMPRYSAMMAGTAPTRPSVASLPAMIRSAGSSFSNADLAERGGQGPRGLDRVGAVEGRVVDVHGLVGTHGQRLADGVGGAVRTGGEHGHLAALGLLDQQRFFDGALVDLVEHGVGGLAVEREVTVGELALGPGVGDLLDQNDDVRHGSSSTSCVFCVMIVSCSASGRALVVDYFVARWLCDRLPHVKLPVGNLRGSLVHHNGRRRISSL